LDPEIQANYPAIWPHVKSHLRSLSSHQDHHLIFGALISLGQNRHCGALLLFTSSELVFVIKGHIKADVFGSFVAFLLF